MSRLFSSLATIWRLARPYFFSEDRRAGRILLGAVIAIELSIVAINVMLNQWYNRFYNALQERDWNAFVYELCCSACWRPPISACRLSALSQSVAPDPMASMDDPAISRSLACRRQSLPHAAPGRCGGQSRPAHSEDINLFIERTLTLSIGLLSAVVTLCSFVVILWALSAAAPLNLFGSNVCHSRLSGLGGAALCRGGHHADPSRRVGHWCRLIFASSASRRISASISSACARTRSR